MDALKEWFNRDFYRDLASALKKHHRTLDTEAFYQDAIVDLEQLEFKGRLLRSAEICHRHLPDDYRRAVAVLRRIAPRYKGEFTGMFCPEFVGLYGLDNVDFSLEALEYFTTFSSSEFAVRPFLRQDLQYTLAVMEGWSSSANHHVRRLASEGCRPRLPWSFQLQALLKDPAPVVPILNNLRADSSLYVRKSVSNHLNDISKDHPEWMLDWVAGWERDDEHTAWIVKRAARSLIKAGHARTFVLLGFEEKPQVEVGALVLSAQELRLGASLSFSFVLKSQKQKTQKLAVDYAVHYVKKLGQTRSKVFKLKELSLVSGGEVEISKKHLFKDFSTRKHYAGRHRITVMVNGVSKVERAFDLVL